MVAEAVDQSTLPADDTLGPVGHRTWRVSLHTMGNCAHSSKKKTLKHGHDNRGKKETSKEPENVVYATIDHRQTKSASGRHTTEDECEYSTVVPSKRPVPQPHSISEIEDSPNEYVLME